MPIKTLHITNAFHPTSGGISTFYRSLLNGAERLGRTMTLVVPGDRTRIEPAGEFTRIHHIKAPQAPFFDRRYRLLLPQTYLPGLNGVVKQILRDEKPDLVEICDKYSVSWLAGLLRRNWLAGIPRPALVGLNCERMDDNVGAFLTKHTAGTRWSQRFLGKLYIPLFDAHIANSQYTADELLGAMRPNHQRPVHVLPMGAQIEAFAAARPNDFHRRRLLARLGGDERTRLLLYAGRLSPEKNIPLLLEVMERLANDDRSDFRLVLAGDGPLVDWIESEARRRVPGRVLSLGHVHDREALIRLYANCDAFVHPNPREPFGIAPLEAMAAGLPLIAPRAGGVLSYADESNSWLTCAQGDTFAAAVRAVFADASLRKDKLTRARWAAAQYRWEEVTERFFALYDYLHAEFPGSRRAHSHRPHPAPERSSQIVHEKV